MAISPQLAEHSAKISRRNKLTFDVLSDLGNQIAANFGIVFTLPDDVRHLYQQTFKLDLGPFNGDDSWTLPMPGRFIFRQDGTLFHADADPDYTVRPEASTTVEHLRRLVTS